MKKNFLALLFGLLTIANVQTLSATEGVDEAKRFLKPYVRFCSDLSFALEHGDVDKLVELTEPAFRVVLTNDISRFSLRFNELRKSRVYCDTRGRRELYDVELNSAIDRCIGGEIVDLVPIRVICLKDSRADMPTFDHFHVNTLLHTNGSIRIMGRFILGPYNRPEEVVTDFSALNSGYLDNGTEIYRTGRMCISASESAWRIARRLKEAFSQGESMESFRTKVSTNCMEDDVVKELKGLSAYNICAIVPFGTDSQYMLNTVDAREGDISAYVMVVYAAESPAREVGLIRVIVGAEQDFRITDAFDEGRMFGAQKSQRPR